jgi:uncharacterized Ntn-hydrolase superfamily protein
MSITVPNPFNLVVQKLTSIHVGRRLALVATLLVVPTMTQATYSIVATDSKTRQVGGSATSCIGSIPISIIYGSAPNHGAIHAQARFDYFISFNLLNKAAHLLAKNTPAAAVIGVITDPKVDPRYSERQYGVVEFGRAAGYTGTANNSYANDIQGTIETYAYSIQGNLLTSQAVLDQAKAAFVSGGCDLADRLMLALEAGAQNGEGDQRCTPNGIPSDSAFIHVDAADKTVVLHLEAVGTAPTSPLLKLRNQYNAWRKDNPCPKPILNEN